MFCKNCGKEIDNKASVCVHCGVAVKQKKSLFKKWWFWVIIAVVIAVVSGGSSSDSSSESGSSGTSPAEQTNQETVVYEKLDLMTMMNELDSNAMKAETNYQNKYVEVVGKISNFDSDGEYISIKPVNADEWFFDSAMCYIKNDEQKNLLMEKSIGDTVVIKGKIKSIGEVMGYSIDIKEIG